MSAGECYAVDDVVSTYTVDAVCTEVCTEVCTKVCTRQVSCTWTLPRCPLWVHVYMQ